MLYIAPFGRDRRVEQHPATASRATALINRRGGRRPVINATAATSARKARRPSAGAASAGAVFGGSLIASAAHFP